MLLTSCGNDNKKEVGGIASAGQTDLVKTSIEDSKGNKMNIVFDNIKGVATVEFNGTKFQLNRDTTASGVKMMNDKYLYEEWQGHITLKKNGEVVFDNKQ
ncbi:hypothetical protein D0T50_05960 [Bacteroides sp. 214]|nr:hypothetical protein [Bacteroides sp. 214]